MKPLFSYHYSIQYSNNFEDRALIYLIEKKHSVKSLSKAADLKVKKYFQINPKRSNRVELSADPIPFIIEVVEKPLILNTAYGVDSELNDITYYYEGLFEWQLRFHSRFVSFNYLTIRQFQIIYILFYFSYHVRQI